MQPPPGLYIDGTLYPFDASRPADAELLAINAELLAALESVLDFANDSGLPCDLEREPEFIAARALIAKAKGIAE